jgi:hypothetical protein
MTDTPETDAIREDIWATPYVEGQDFSLMVDHAKKLERERDSLIASLKFHAELNKELAAERSRLEKAFRVLIYWRDISECVCSDPLPNGGCLRCDFDKIFNETICDTPETDHLENGLGTAAEMSHPTLWAFARKLEHERDDAIEMMRRTRVISSPNHCVSSC